jgi:alanyl-tRNA synthetase
LGEHVQQKGSLVDDMKTRFDFSHPKPVTREELGKIELLVNEVIRRNIAVSARVMSYDKALETGAVALFGEKYGDQVRVIGMDGFSTELCGGTHVDRSGDIGLFKIYSETGVASGVRRIEAATGAAALNYTQDREGKLLEIASVMRAAPDEAEGRLAQIMENVRKLEKEVERLKSKIAANQGDEFAQNVRVVDGVNVLSTIIEGVDVKALRDTMDQLKSKLGTAVIALSTINEGKISIITGVTSDTTGRIKAGDLVNFIAEQVGGKGGGRPDLAQAGGSDAAALPKAMSSVNDWVASQLN